MTGQENRTKEFFNRIANQYHSKYGGGNLFSQYFFNERLLKATAGLPLENKTILDIGAGTGNLFDYLMSKFGGIDYYAVDIAAEMLANSHIPMNRQFVGKCYEVDIPISKFQVIFMLGVSTYLDEEELNKTLDFIQRSLQSNGMAVMSFTNRAGWDTKIRQLVKKPGRLFRAKNRVLGQSFGIFPKTIEEVKACMPDQLKIDKTLWLNHTLFPFNKLFPAWSIRKAQKIDAHWQGKKLIRRSSDFLVFCSKKTSIM